MKILALDTALSHCSAAVVVDGIAHAQESQAMTRGHAEALAPMIHRVLGRARLRVAALDRIAVTVGPGSFTGVRVGLAAARGLALASGVPAVGVTTLEALAAMAAAIAGRAALIVAAISARRDRVYLQAFRAGPGAAEVRPLAAPDLLKLEDAVRALPDGACLLVGSGAPGLADAAGDRCWLVEEVSVVQSPAIEVVAALGASKPNPATRFGPAPLYLRPPDARLPAGPAGAP